MLAVLAGEENAKVKSVILRIVELRMSRRLASLIWALSQYYYESPEIRQAAVLAVSAECCTGELMRELFGREQDIVEAAVAVIRQSGGLIGRVIGGARIVPGSPLCRNVVLSYFRQGSEQDFLRNEEFFLQIIRQTADEEILPVLIHYLNLPWELYSSRRINRALHERFGLPEDGVSPLWASIDPGLIRKFLQWVFVDVMEDFFGADSRKFAVFSKYNRDMVHLHLYQEDQVLVLDFGPFGIVHSKENAETAWLMEKLTLQRELNKLSGGDEPGWTRMREDIEARDVIIEEKSADVLVLNVGGIGKLYVEELMQELLRKEDEIWPVRFRHAVLRFKESAVRQSDSLR